MTKSPISAEGIVTTPDYQKKRREYDAQLKELWEVRSHEAQSLLDDLKNFNLRYDNIHELVDEPVNTFALAIPRMVEYLDIFVDQVNLGFLIMSLARPEGRGLVASPMIKFYQSSELEDIRFQASKAILATAEPCNVDDIIDLLFERGASAPEKVLFLRGITNLKKKGAIPVLIRCLCMEEEVIIEALKLLKKLKVVGIGKKIENLQDHKSVKVRRLAKSLE